MLCARNATLSDAHLTHYSSGRALVLEFRTDLIASNHTGFSGTYKFLNRSDFEQTGGEALSGTPCDYEFLSPRIHSVAASGGGAGRDGGAGGQFFSPNYPSHYPKHAKCAYYFMAGYQEKGKVVHAEL